MSDSQIDEKSTTEDVVTYAEQIVREIKAERQGEKSDAQVVNNTAAPTNTPAVKKSGETPAEAKDNSDDRAIDGDDSDDTESDWLTDDVKAEAAAYGIDESEIADFSSREELDRALRLFDKSALEAGRKSIAEDGDGNSRNEKGQFEKKESATAKNLAEGSYQVSLDKDLYDEEIISEFTRMRDHYESRLDALESRFQDVNSMAEEQRFDNLVDTLEFPELFGKTGHESEKELERRQDLLVALKAQMIGLKNLNRPAEMNQNLVSRVARMVYADDMLKKELKKRTRNISKQSNSRQGGGQTRPQDSQENPRDEADRLYRELTGQQ